MIKLVNVQTNTEIGEITQSQLDFLISQLEEESATDRDYYINQATLDYFTQQGADPALVSLLRDELAGRSDMDIRWVIT
ncbi:MAG: galactosyldiacylglycerol synthase [Caldilineaceae bacterium]|nr:galactosyldiacylglycerol synthase [Caldilineaceae bacterium]